MRMPAVRLAALLCLGVSHAAAADVPRVATDITPVHSLVAQVMGDLGQPDLVVRPGMSPHGYAMRPSEARALDRADLVVWIGPGLTPWLEDAIGALAEGARVLDLLDAPQTATLPTRSGARFERHVHGDDHGHDDHDDAHGEEAHETHDGHDHEGHDHAHDDHAHEDHEGHDHGDAHAHGTGPDPHAWLDPVNAAEWVWLIAAELSRLDPQNAVTYSANAAQAQADLAALEAEISDQLAGLSDRPFLVFHDAYQYFETRFGVTAAGAVSLGDASEPGPARLSELRGLVDAENIVCAFAEPQFNTAILDRVFGDDLRTATLDPLGQDQPAGPGLYPALLRSMAGAMTDCLTPEG